jgi:predicted HTH transcriptional regulator
VPPLALREALINAIVHADYAQRGAPTRVSVFDDRVEIENPGVLLPGLTVDELRDGVSRLRNHVIGRVFKELGLIEQWGSGVQRMTSACLSAGLPEPELEEVGLRFRVTLRLVADGPVLADDLERRILDYLSIPDGRSTAELATHIQRTPRTAQQRLAKLAGRGLVVALGSGPQDPRRRWATVENRPRLPDQTKPGKRKP